MMRVRINCPVCGRDHNVELEQSSEGGMWRPRKGQAPDEIDDMNAQAAAMAEVLAQGQQALGAEGQARAQALHSEIKGDYRATEGFVSFDTAGIPEGDIRVPIEPEANEAEPARCCAGREPVHQRPAYWVPVHCPDGRKVRGIEVEVCGACMKPLADQRKLIREALLRHNPDIPGQRWYTKKDWPQVSCQCQEGPEL